MKTLKNLMEKRRNPLKNPTSSAYDKLSKYQQDKNIYISFTNIDKIGINPHNKFNTPTGIYTYPLNAVFGKIIMAGMVVKKWSTYGADRPFIQVLKHNGKGGKFIKDIGVTYSVSDLAKDSDKLRKMFPEKNTKDVYKAQEKMEKFRSLFTSKFGDYDSAIESMFQKLSRYAADFGDTDFAYNLDDYIERINNDINEIYTALKNNNLDISPTAGIMNLLISSLSGKMFDISFRMNQLFLDIDEESEEREIAHTGFRETISSFMQQNDKILTSLGNISAQYAGIYQSPDAKNKGIEWSISHGSAYANDQTSGGKIWNITRLVANGHSEDKKAGSVHRWNKVWRDLGYAGVCDLSGNGIIHPAEKTQAIFFSMKAVDHVDMILNKTHAKSFKVKNLKHFFDTVGMTGKDIYSWSGFIYMLGLGDRPKVENRSEFMVMLADHLIKNYKKFNTQFSFRDRDTMAYVALKYGKMSSVKKSKPLLSDLKKAIWEDGSVIDDKLFQLKKGDLRTFKKMWDKNHLDRFL